MNCNPCINWCTNCAPHWKTDAAMFKATSFATTLSLAVLVALGPLSTDMYLPALPGMTHELSTSPAQVQLTLSLVLAGFALAQIIYGPLSDRFGRKPVLLSGLLLFVLASAGCAMSTDIHTLIVFRFLQALGGSAGPVLGRAIVRDIHGPRNAARVLSHIASAMALAPAIAPIAGGFMSLYWGWTSIFWFLALFGLAGAALLQFKIVESSPEEHRHPKTLATIFRDYASLLRDRQYLGYMLTCSFSYAGLFCFLSGASFVIIEYFRIPQQWFGALFALVVLGYISGTLLGGKLSYRKGYRELVQLGALTCMLSGLVMLGLTLGEITHVASVIAPMMLFMSGVGLVMPQSMAGALANYPHMAGSASGLLGFIQMSSAGIAGAFVGHGYDGTPLVMSTGIAGMGVLTVCAYALLIHKRGGQEGD